MPATMRVLLIHEHRHDVAESVVPAAATPPSRALGPRSVARALLANYAHPTREIRPSSCPGNWERRLAAGPQRAVPTFDRATASVAS